MLYLKFYIFVKNFNLHKLIENTNELAKRNPSASPPSPRPSSPRTTFPLWRRRPRHLRCSRRHRRRTRRPKFCGVRRRRRARRGRSPSLRRRWAGWAWSRGSSCRTPPTIWPTACRPSVANILYLKYKLKFEMCEKKIRLKMQTCRTEKSISYTNWLGLYLKVNKKYDA